MSRATADYCYWIRERGSFDSGSALLNTAFVGVIDKIADALTQIEGKIYVEGHTDNVPINTFTYPSNWDCRLLVPSP